MTYLEHTETDPACFVNTLTYTNFVQQTLHKQTLSPYTGVSPSFQTNFLCNELIMKRNETKTNRELGGEVIQTQMPRHTKLKYTVYIRHQQRIHGL